MYQDCREKEWASSLSKSLACTADDASDEEDTWTMDQIYVVRRNSLGTTWIFTITIFYKYLFAQSDRHLYTIVFIV